MFETAAHSALAPLDRAYLPFVAARACGRTTCSAPLACARLGRATATWLALGAVVAGAVPQAIHAQAATAAPAPSPVGFRPGVTEGTGVTPRGRLVVEDPAHAARRRSPPGGCTAASAPGRAPTARRW